MEDNVKLNKYIFLKIIRILLLKIKILIVMIFN